MFCGKCGTEIKEDDGYCVKCGNKAVKKKEQTEQSVNNWTDLYQSAKKSSKKKPQKKVVAKNEKEEKLAEYEKDYLKRLKKKPRKKAVKKEVWLGKIVDIKEPPKSSSPPQPSFSFSGRLPTFLIAGFVMGFIMFAIIGLSSSSDPYGCTQCDPFLPGYDGPPPIEMDLGIDDYYYDDGYYDDGYYYDDYYYP